MLHKRGASEKTETIFKKFTVRVPCLGSSVPPIGSRVSNTGSHRGVGSPVSDLGSHLKGPRSRVPGPTCEMGPGSWVSDLTKSSESWVALFRYALIIKYDFLHLNWFYWLFAYNFLYMFAFYILSFSNCAKTRCLSSL